MVALQQFPVLQLHPSKPGGGQHAAAAEHPLHLRHHHGGVVFKQLGEAFGVIGFELVVDFAKQRLTELINDGGEVVAEVERQKWPRQLSQQANHGEIQPQPGLQIRPLHLDRHPAAIEQLGFVDLAEAGRRYRMIREGGKQLLSRRSQFRLDGGQGLGVIKRRQVVLQPGELVQPIALHQVRPGGEGLAQLDEAGAQARERVQQALAQTALNRAVFAAALNDQGEAQATELPEHHHQAAHQLMQGNGVLAVNGGAPCWADSRNCAQVVEVAAPIPLAIGASPCQIGC